MRAKSPKLCDFRLARETKLILLRDYRMCTRIKLLAAAFSVYFSIELFVIKRFGHKQYGDRLGTTYTPHNICAFSAKSLTSIRFKMPNYVDL